MLDIISMGTLLFTFIMLIVICGNVNKSDEKKDMKIKNK